MSLSEQTILDARECASRYPDSRSALLPLLHLVQSEEGTVTADGIALCADVLGLTTAEVAGVATDTWGAEVRPNETPDTTQPWHWVCIPVEEISGRRLVHVAGREGGNDEPERAAARG